MRHAPNDLIIRPCNPHRPERLGFCRPEDRDDGVHRRIKHPQSNKRNYNAGNNSNNISSNSSNNGSSIGNNNCPALLDEVKKKKKKKKKKKMMKGRRRGWRWSITIKTRPFPPPWERPPPINVNWNQLKRQN